MLAVAKCLSDFEACARDPRRADGFDHDMWVEYYEPYLKESIGILRTMAREEAEHDKTPRLPLEKLPLKQRIAELIFRLRDQEGDIWMNPDNIGEVQVSSPDYQLFEIGEPAIAALRAMIGDPRFTRASTVGERQSRTHIGPPRAIRIGDAAIAIIGHILHPYLSVRSGLGERELANAVRIGGDAEGNQALEFTLRHPARAREVLVQGLSWTSDVKRQANLLAQLTLLNPENHKLITDWYERTEMRSFLVLMELGTELANEKPCLGCTIHLKSGTYIEPRTCDLAAEMLTVLAPQAFKYDLSGSPEQKATQLAACRAKWKEFNFMRPRPQPENDHVSIRAQELP